MLQFLKGTFKRLQIGILVQGGVKQSVAGYGYFLELPSS